MRLIRVIADNWEVVFVFALAVVLLLMAFGCATAEAIQDLPESWWVATERVFLALLEDLWSVLTLLA